MSKDESDDCYPMFRRSSKTRFELISTDIDLQRTVYNIQYTFYTMNGVYTVEHKTHTFSDDTYQWLNIEHFILR